LAATCASVVLSDPARLAPHGSGGFESTSIGFSYSATQHCRLHQLLWRAAVFSMKAFRTVR